MMSRTIGWRARSRPRSKRASRTMLLQERSILLVPGAFSSPSRDRSCPNVSLWDKEQDQHCGSDLKSIDDVKAGRGFARQVFEPPHSKRTDPARQIANLVYEPPLEHLIRVTADPYDPNRTGDKRHRREKSDHRVAGDAKVRNNRRSPKTQRRVDADEAEVDEGEKPHARRPQRVVERVRLRTGLATICRQLGED